MKQYKYYFSNRQGEIGLKELVLKGYVANASEVDNVIGQDTIFHGSIDSSQSIRIDGSYLGKSLKANYIVVGASGRVRANIFAETVVVEGILSGDVTANVRVVLQPGSKLVGNIVTSELITTKGVEFEGNCRVAASLDSDIKSSVSQYFQTADEVAKTSGK